VKDTGKLVVIKEKSLTDPPPVHLRGGSIIPMSVKTEHKNTNSVRQSAINLLVLPDQSKRGSGDLFWDDGESIDTIGNGVYNYYTFELLDNCSVVLNVKHNNYTNVPIVEEIRVYDTTGGQITATIDGKSTGAVVDKDGSARIHTNLDLKTKKAGEQWVISWTDTSKKCNLN
jgi:alpha-glucosidase (family GH31 glycosyl hydrolase)